MKDEYIKAAMRISGNFLVGFASGYVGASATLGSQEVNLSIGIMSAICLGALSAGKELIASGSVGEHKKTLKVLQNCTFC